MYSPEKTFIELVKDFEKVNLEKAFEDFLNEYADSDNEDNRTLPQAAGVSEDEFTSVIDGEMSIKDLINKYSKKLSASI